MSEYRVWCDVCGFKKSFNNKEDALAVGKAHKRGYHKMGEE